MAGSIGRLRQAREKSEGALLTEQNGSGFGGVVSPAPDAFRHEALLYNGPADFLRQAGAFIEDSLAAGEPILVVVDAKKIDALRGQLGRDAARVHFADMAGIGANPARIIPAWRDFVDTQRPGRRFRGIGEPIWAARSRDELVECQRHEQLLNLAFDGAPAWWLLCPYDTTSLGSDVLQEAERSHPFMAQSGAHRNSSRYRDLAEVAKPFDLPLPEPYAPTEEISIDSRSLQGLRAFVAKRAAEAGFDPARVSDIVLAANELSTNSVRYGRGGVLRVWLEQEALFIETRDSGHISEPLAGRERPMRPREGGYGLWLANHVSDLVQIRTFPNGSVVRLHFKRP